MAQKRAWQEGPGTVDDIRSRLKRLHTVTEEVENFHNYNTQFVDLVNSDHDGELERQDPEAVQQHRPPHQALQHQSSSEVECVDITDQQAVQLAFSRATSYAEFNQILGQLHIERETRRSHAQSTER